MPMMDAEPDPKVGAGVFTGAAAGALKPQRVMSPCAFAEVEISPSNPSQNAELSNQFIVLCPYKSRQCDFPRTRVPQVGYEEVKSKLTFAAPQ